MGWLRSWQLPIHLTAGALGGIMVATVLLLTSTTVEQAAGNAVRQAEQDASSWLSHVPADRKVETAEAATLMPEPEPTVEPTVRPVVATPTPFVTIASRPTPANSPVYTDIPHDVAPVAIPAATSEPVTMSVPFVTPTALPTREPEAPPEQVDIEPTPTDTAVPHRKQSSQHAPMPAPTPEVRLAPTLVPPVPPTPRPVVPTPRPTERPVPTARPTERPPVARPPTPDDKPPDHDRDDRKPHPTHVVDKPKRQDK